MEKKLIIKRSIFCPDKGQVYIKGVIDEDGNPVIEFSRPIPFGFETKCIALKKKEFLRFFDVFQKLYDAIEK